jgi:hypothetical protein
MISSTTLMTARTTEGNLALHGNDRRLCGSVCGRTDFNAGTVLVLVAELLVLVTELLALVIELPALAAELLALVAGLPALAAELPALVAEPCRGTEFCLSPYN